MGRSSPLQATMCNSLEVKPNCCCCSKSITDDIPIPIAAAAPSKFAVPISMSCRCVNSQQFVLQILVPVADAAAASSKVDVGVSIHSAANFDDVGALKDISWLGLLVLFFVFMAPCFRCHFEHFSLVLVVVLSTHFLFCNSYLFFLVLYILLLPIKKKIPRMDDKPAHDIARAVMLGMFILMGMILFVKKEKKHLLQFYLIQLFCMTSLFCALEIKILAKI